MITVQLKDGSVIKYRKATTFREQYRSVRIIESRPGKRQKDWRGNWTRPLIETVVARLDCSIVARLDIDTAGDPAPKAVRKRK